LGLETHGETSFLPAHAFCQEITGWEVLAFTALQHVLFPGRGATLQDWRAHRAFATEPQFDFCYLMF
jgi:hypothetical protein